MAFDLKRKRIWLAGHRGLVGSALSARLADFDTVVVTATSKELDLRNQGATADFVSRNKFDAIIAAAAVVGGIRANTEHPARFLYDNLVIGANIIHSAHQAGIAKLLLLGSSCMYPRLADQPVSEASLLSGPLEATNEWYAVAKIAGLKLCQAYRREHGEDFIVAVPANLYGPGDNFDLEAGHVVSALMGRLHHAKAANLETVDVWGSGAPTWDFFFIGDCIEGLLHLLLHYSDEGPINLGTSREVSIRELAQTIAGIVGYQGELVFDTSNPDGMPRKVLDVSRIKETGWTATTSLADGLKATYAWYLDHVVDAATVPGRKR